MDKGRPGDARPGRVTILLLGLALLAACSAPCRVRYLYDGSGDRPYYKLRECPGRLPVVECDSATRLPDPATWVQGCR